MAKNITILEGSTSKSFSNVNKLRVNNVGGGTSDWVPEDEVQLTTKHISENGTYTASDDGYYGYSEVTVSGVGGFNYTAGEGDSIGGVDLTEGNEYDISADPETGDVTVIELPSAIAVTHQPDKTSYIDGEEIDPDGLVVQAYTANGDLWENENYFQGTIPVNELILDPTHASAEEADDSEMDVGTTGLTAPVYLAPLSVGMIFGNLEVKNVQGAVYGFIMPITSGSSDTYRAIVSMQQGASITIARANGSFPETHVCNNLREYGGASCYTCLTTIGYIRPDESVPVSAHQSVGAEQAAAIALLGCTRVGQTIAVKWNRFNDSAELSTSFKIRVESSSESSEESGSGAGHSF
ncbi:MAG: hypothetical protein K6F80_06570 [Oscillospiraceae bacterium]|nr:hypothetical protein [Oscillospiraceae bacterium]